MRKLGVLFAFMFMLVAVPTANAAITSVFDGKIPCSTQGNGQRWCQGPSGAANAPLATVRSFDNTPIDVNVGFPNATEFGAGPYPMAMYFHGFGGSKEGLGGDLQRFLDKGIAVFSMTERGFRNSCGVDGWSGRPATYNPNDDAISALQTAGEDCSKGFIHLMDTRYEVRDAQYLAGLLADENVILPKKLGSVGASYGGGKSMALGALKNRIMLPDGTYAPWQSPDGKPMEIAAAAPIVPWTDFAYSLLPNGRTLDYVKDSPYEKPSGIMKIGIASALLPAGDSFSGDIRTLPQPPTGDLNAAKYPVDPNADILGWKARMEQGEPYNDALSDLMFNEMTKHHSSYYVDDSVKPAPLLIAQGFTDDLFPVDEPLRFANRTKAKYPDADISMLFADIGHPRAPIAGPGISQGRDADKEMGFERVDRWFDHYLLGNSPKPVNQVEVKTQVCPYTEPSGGPYTAPTWPGLSPGEVQFKDATERTISATSGLDAPVLKFSSLNPGCGQVDNTVEPGTVNYEIGTAPAGGITLMGAPTIIADVTVANGSDSQIAARLLEIDAGGKQRLISRAAYRPDASGPQVIQLHGNGYKFKEGTKIRLQLLPKDGMSIGLTSYTRPSNNQMDVKIKDLDFRMPVMEQPGAASGMVKAPQPEVLPAGAELAGDYSGIGSITIAQWAAGDVTPAVGPLSLNGKPIVKGKVLIAKVKCGIGYTTCSKTNLVFKGAPKKGKKGKGLVIAKGKTGTAMSGKAFKVTLPLSKAARSFFKDRRKNGKKVSGPNSLRAKVLINGKSRGFTTVKRVARVK